MKSRAGAHTLLSRIASDDALAQALTWLDYAPRLPRTFASWRSGLGPVRVGDELAIQPNELTCGAAVATLLNAGYDRHLWQQLRTGGGFTAQTQLAHLRMRANHIRPAGLGPRTMWPASLGTPPWGLARELKIPGVRYTHRPVNDRDGALMDDVIDLLLGATAKGYPVPFYTGGSLADGIKSAVPRHVVAALPRMPAMTKLRIYEPSSGRIYLLDAHQLRRRTTRARALGNWTSMAWLLIPVPMMGA